MDIYENFEHLDNFYKKIAQSSGFSVKENGSLVITTGLDNVVFNYVRFNSSDTLFWQKVLQKISAPFIAFPNQDMKETNLHELSTVYHLKKLGEVIAHRYQCLKTFIFEKTNPHLTIKLVNNFQEIEDVDFLSALSLHHPQGYMKKFIQGIPETGFKVDGLFCFIAYLDTLPVGQSFLAIHNNVPGLYFDSVHPDYRRQGIETEMIKTRMEFARDLGFDQIVVQCMSSSINIFQKIGFKPQGTLPMYMYDPPNSSHI